MKITVEFESLAEFRQHMTGTVTQQDLTVKPAPETPYHEELHALAQEIAQAAPEAPEEAPAAPTTCAPASPVEIPWEKTEEAPAAPAAPVTEDFRVEVRKTLAALNKATGRNAAKELIGRFGASKLTEVVLADLPELARLAEEALHAK